MQIDELHLDLAPSGWLLVTTHDDQPGVVGLLTPRSQPRQSTSESSWPGRTADGLARGFLSLYGQTERQPVRSVRLVQL